MCEREGELTMSMLCAVEVEPIFSPVKVVKTQPKSFIAVEIRSSRAADSDSVPAPSRTWTSIDFDCIGIAAASYDLIASIVSAVFVSCLHQRTERQQQQPPPGNICCGRGRFVPNPGVRVEVGDGIAVARGAQ